MQQSFTSRAAAQQHGLAAGYQHMFGIPVVRELPYARSMLPSGFLISSAEDMAHYLVAQVNGGRYGDQAVLSSSGIDAMHQPAASMGHDQNSQPEYGNCIIGNFPINANEVKWQAGER